MKFKKIERKYNKYKSRNYYYIQNYSTMKRLNKARNQFLEKSFSSILEAGPKTMGKDATLY